VFREEAQKAMKTKLREPEVGIFFVVDGKNLFVDSTPLSQASTYGDALTHEKGHPQYWDELLAAYVVPDLEYDAVPRGRVNFNMTTRDFLLLADRCILRHPAVVERIKDQMDLPPQTTCARDEHYLCPGCMGENRTALMLELPDDIR
jgi:hypothetical protein